LKATYEDLILLRAQGERVAYLDRLKVLLVAVIIAGHGVLGYSGMMESAWPYQEVQEVRLTEVADVMVGMVVLPGVLFSMGLFFLISGLVTPGSLARKGPWTFARHRLVRLGVPLVAWVLVIWPALNAAMHSVVGDDRSVWWEFVHADPFLDTGPMWFVEVLLIYSLAYAAWRAWHRSDGPHARTQLSGWMLVALAAGISITTGLVRLVYPFLSAQVAHIQLWQWPQYLAMFGLGVVAAQRGWLEPVPERIRRACGVAAVLSILVFVALAGAVAAAGLEPQAFVDLRVHWAPLGLAVIEGPLVVGASVWVLGTAQRRLDRPPGRTGRALARSAFAAFVLQGVVLIGVALALRAAELPAEVKAAAVAAVGVAGSFMLAWVLVIRTPVGRIL
jgi:hypothetical protein